MEFEKLKEIIASILNIEIEMIERESKLIDDLGADSIDLFQIITAVEDEFNIEISNDEFMNIVTIGDAADRILLAGKH